MKILQIALIAFGMLTVSQANAQRETKEDASKEKPGKAMKKFNRLDANGDGVLVLSELQKAKSKKEKDQVNRFNRMDVNNDSRVTFEEFKKFKKAKKVKKMKKGQGRK